MKTVVIYHKADFDGIFCREIAKKFLPEAELIGWDYGDPEPVVDAGVDLYILDLSVPGLMSHPNLTWIDHHGTAIDQYAALVDKRYCVVGVSACRLAWQWFNGFRRGFQDFVNREVQEPLAVQLAGEYDVWDKRDPRAEVFQHGLRSCDLTGLWDRLLTAGTIGSLTVEELLNRGSAVQYATERSDASIIKAQGFTVEFEGMRFLALNTARCNSLAFSAGLTPEHDGCLGFNWTGKGWRVSLYGVPDKPELDFAPIALKYGGGGHRQACGFRTDFLPFVVNEDPKTIEQLRVLLEQVKAAKTEMDARIAAPVNNEHVAPGCEQFSSVELTTKPEGEPAAA